MKSVIWGLSLALLAGSAIADQELPSTDKWEVQVKMDEFTDKKTVRASIKQLDQKPKSYSFAWIDCTEGEVVLGVSNGTYNTDSKLYDAKIRVDKMDPFFITAKRLNGNFTHYFPISEQWSQAFKVGNRTIIQTSGGYFDKVIKFKLNGFTSAYNEVSESCK